MRNAIAVRVEVETVIAFVTGRFIKSVHYHHVAIPLTGCGAIA